MSEDRTQAPSKHRIQQAREQGQVAHSPELTAAGMLLAATGLLGYFGETIIGSLTELLRSSWTGEPIVTLSHETFVDHVRSVGLEVIPACFSLFLGILAAAVVVHQAQVRGLWAPALLAPNLGRLWGGQNTGLSTRLGRGVWMLLKTTIVVALSIWAVYSRMPILVGLSNRETASLAQTAVSLLRQLTGMLALAMFVLGLIDYVLQHQRFEALLRLTPAEFREDQKAMDGDPAMRARRLRVAKSWRGDAPELLVGATLAVTGANGLIALLGGGPPPRKILVRSSAKGATGIQLARSVERAKIPILENPGLARRLALVRLPSLPPELVSELKSVWPVTSESGNG